MGDLSKTFEAVAMDYLQYQAARNRDVRTPAHQIHVLGSFFAGRIFSQITGKDWRAFVQARLEKGVSHGTINRHRAAMSRMSALAIERGDHLGPNPTKDMPQFRESKGRYAYLSEAQCDELIRAARAPYQSYIYLAIETMARRRELTGSRVSAFHFEPSFLEITPELAKNGERRMIPLPKMAALILRTLCKGKGPEDRIFSVRGFGFKALQRNFKAAARKAGFPDLRLHDLRHVGASLATERGMDERRLMEIMGHKDSKTCRRYAHLSPQHMADAVRFMGLSHLSPRKS